jgi:Caspase domain
LIIGINEYISPNIPNLAGAVPDSEAMRGFLQTDLRVPSSQIRILRNSEATRANIIDGIRAFPFNDDINEGDPILIYYVGHGGSTVVIPEGWYVGSTGRIELLIPFDYCSPMENGERPYAQNPRSYPGGFALAPCKQEG